MHEVVVLPSTVEAAQRQRAAGRPQWRISSTLDDDVGGECVEEAQRLALPYLTTRSEYDDPARSRSGTISASMRGSASATRAAGGGAEMHVLSPTYSLSGSSSHVLTLAEPSL